MLRSLLKSRLSKGEFHYYLAPGRLSEIKTPSAGSPNLTIQDLSQFHSSKLADPEKNPQPVLPEVVLRKISGNDKSISILLSAHFCRYLMFDQVKELKHASDRLAYAKHRFEKTYGSAIEGWEIKTTRLGSSWLASAVDISLLTEIRAALSDCPNIAVTIQPCFSYFSNLFRRTFLDKSGWIILAEHEFVTLGLIRSGRWKHFCTRRLSTSPQSSIFDILNREERTLGIEKPQNIWFGGTEQMLGVPHSEHIHMLWKFSNAVLVPGASHALAA